MQECDFCGGIGTIEDRKGNVLTCPSCNGRGISYEQKEPKNEK